MSPAKLASIALLLALTNSKDALAQDLFLAQRSESTNTSSPAAGTGISRTLSSAPRALFSDATIKWALTQQLTDETIEERSSAKGELVNSLAESSGMLLTSIIAGDWDSLAQGSFDTAVSALPALAALGQAFNLLPGGQLVGLLVTFFTSFLGGLFGSDDGDSTSTKILEQVQKMIHLNNFRAQLSLAQDRLEGLMEELRWVPAMLMPGVATPDTSSSVWTFEKQTGDGYCTPWGTYGDLCKPPALAALTGTCANVDSAYYSNEDLDEAVRLCTADPNCAGYTKKLSSNKIKFKSAVTGIEGSGFECWKKVPVTGVHTHNTDSNKKLVLLNYYLTMQNELALLKRSIFHRECVNAVQGSSHNVAECQAFQGAGGIYLAIPFVQIHLSTLAFIGILEPSFRADIQIHANELKQEYNKLLWSSYQQFQKKRLFEDIRFKIHRFQPYTHGTEYWCDMELKDDLKPENNYNQRSYDDCKSPGVTNDSPSYQKYLEIKNYFRSISKDMDTVYSQLCKLVGPSSGSAMTFYGPKGWRSNDNLCSNRDYFYGPADWDTNEWCAGILPGRCSIS